MGKRKTKSPAATAAATPAAPTPTAPEPVTPDGLLQKWHDELNKLKPEVVINMQVGLLADIIAIIGGTRAQVKALEVLVTAKKESP